MSIVCLSTRLVKKEMTNISSVKFCLRYFHQENKKTYLNRQYRLSQLRFKSSREYVLSRYMDFVQNYEAVLEKRFPAAIRVYRVFMVGIKEFYKDLKMFFSVVHKLNLTGKGLDSLTRKELEIYHQMPKDMIKVSPVLLLSALPFANYVIFPLAYMLPRQLLTSHFWSLQQRAEFALIEQKNRLKHFKPVFRSLQWPLEKLESHSCYVCWEKIIRFLGSGLHPSTAEVIQCTSLFTAEPYGLNYMYSSHLITFNEYVVVNNVLNVK
uniref:Letm1 RBD domain-containing protein n=1 Tax=Clastoptera arizonana TaxID=38151 RepID=A0A1B6C6Z9_9HEMI